MNYSLKYINEDTMNKYSLDITQWGKKNKKG